MAPQETNMPTKTAVKKITRAKRPSNKSQQKVKRPVKKNTWDDFQAGFEELRKAQKEAWAAIRETQKARDEAWKAIRETQKNIGGLSNTLGSIVEHILTPGLPKKFKKLGFSFNRIATVYAQIDGSSKTATKRSR